MILVWGPADDPPVEHVLARLERRGADAIHVDDEALAALGYDVVFGEAPSGRLEIGDRAIGLDDLEALYLRPGDARPDPRSREEIEAAAMLLAIASSTPATVVNRPSAGRSNCSKPLQLQQIAAAGLKVPETLVTTDPAAARGFLRDHRRIVYKSISAVRSIVATLDGQDADRLAGVATGPVQLQRWIAGADVRVHVVGGKWFATRIDSEADDYRYAARDGIAIEMTPFEIPPDLGRRLVRLSARMGLLVSGIDLRLTDGGEWFCFEVNPSPGFTYYEEATGQPIADAIAGLLCGRSVRTRLTGPGRAGRAATSSVSG
jgi:glutathione synthase/RimK-type ligase-like ATP-grasp enzyme